MSSKPTIQMIADLAGVSRGTVDRVLNNRSYVSQDVRERILKIVEEVGYISPKDSLLKQRQAERHLRLGVLLPNFEHQFLEEVQEGIEKARAELEDAGVEILVRKCCTDLPEEAVSLLEELEQKGVQGLSVCALNDQTVAHHLAELKEKGLPCVTFNSDLPESGRLFFISQDIKKTGRLAAELLLKCIRPGEKILVTVGNKKYDGHSQRLKGFTERLFEAGFPEESLLTGETYNDYARTVEVIGKAIAENPSLKGIYMANLNIYGCVEAIRSAGRQGDIHVVCHDINPGIKRLLLEGKVDYTIPQDFVYQGYAPLMILTGYMRGKDFYNSFLTEGTLQILCRENVL